MLSHYFKFKTKTKEFENRIKEIISDLKGQKVLVCGDSEGFNALNRQYNLIENINIVGFVEDNLKRKGIRKIKNYKMKQLSAVDFDCILITGENPDPIIMRLTNELDEDRVKIKLLFNEKIRNAGENLDFLLKHKFDKTFKHLSEKLKDKRVLFYGGGLFFQLLNEYYDLSSLNAIGIVDKKLCQLSKHTEICGYKLYSPEQILELNPDYIVLTTRRVVSVWEDLYFNYLKGTNIKTIPIVKRGLLSVIIDG